MRGTGHQPDITGHDAPEWCKVAKTPAKTGGHPRTPCPVRLSAIQPDIPPCHAVTLFVSAIVSVASTTGHLSEETPDICPFPTGRTHPSSLEEGVRPRSSAGGRQSRRQCRSEK